MSMPLLMRLPTAGCGTSDLPYLPEMMLSKRRGTAVESMLVRTFLAGCERQYMVQA